MNNYIFPFQLINKNAKIVLYGAGAVGHCFYKQLQATGYAEVVLWVDAQWKKMREMGMTVNSVADIGKLDTYDYVVIAIENVRVAGDIKEMLLVDYQVPDHTIVYSENYRVTALEVKTVFDEKTIDYEKLEQINPVELLSARRLDLVVRYLLAKDIKNNIRNDANLSLYTRMILARGNAHEGKDYFSEYSREGTREYIEAFKKVCQNMKDLGFDKRKFVPVGDNRVLLNGAHRTAAALALEEKIWAKYYRDQQGNTDFGIEWFEKNGFNWEDKIRILRGYADLYKKCGIMLLFAPCMEHWDYLQMQLAKKMTIVGTVELDFSDNYIAFENLFREIYSDPLWRNVYIDRKVDMLKMAPLKLRVLLLSDEGNEKGDFFEVLCSAKLELRDRMFFDTDIAPVVMHGSDSEKEFEHLKGVILSVNNLKHLNMRTARNYSEEFISRLEWLKDTLKQKMINQSDICICGSSGYEIFGLRKADDLDFFVKSVYRKWHGSKTTAWNEYTHYTRKDSIEVSEENVYLDDLLIEDDNYHYIFNGLKFVNLNIMNEKKKYNGREKDIRDNRLYELFMDYAMNFENKALLKQQIENEFYKKR